MADTPVLPDDTNTVLPEDRVPRDDRDVLDLTLRDQHPIERISVGPLEEARAQGVAERDREDVHAILFRGGRAVASDRTGQRVHLQLVGSKSGVPAVIANGVAMPTSGDSWVAWFEIQFLTDC